MIQKYLVDDFPDSFVQYVPNLTVNFVRKF